MHRGHLLPFLASATAVPLAVGGVARAHSGSAGASGIDPATSGAIALSSHAS
jgi:hypothetical protein